MFFTQLPAVKRKTPRRPPHFSCLHQSRVIKARPIRGGAGGEGVEEVEEVAEVEEEEGGGAGRAEHLGTNLESNNEV